VADLQNYSLTAGGAATLTLPQHTIAGRVTDSTTGATLADFTGDSALSFPSVLATLTAAQRDELLSQIAQQILLMKAGLL
jgi:hypothetical protein